MSTGAVELLLPRPVEAELVGRACALPGLLTVLCPQNAAWSDGQRWLWPLRDLLGPPASGAPLADLRVRRDSDGSASDVDSTMLEIAVDESLSNQEYRLEIDGSRWKITASSARGASYGCCTLAQWLRLHAGQKELPGLRVVDRPLLPTRGFMLDVSRNKVPRLDTLLLLIDRLALLKINHLQLYTEHTFAYGGHEPAWQGWSPLTAADLEQIAQRCRERFVELVPNQNSFGHFHRWLKHDRYRPLAECPEGIEHPFSRDIEPFSLCATDPAVLDLLAELYDQLLPCFPQADQAGKALFNVGLDETFDLGQGRSADAVDERGRAAVYLEFLERVHALCANRGRRMLFWGDIVIEHPELVGRLPSDVLALVWGYEQHHDWQEICPKFSAAGVEHWVCPGTSSWNSFCGRATNALRNVARACAAGAEHGATGLVMTDWGDSGHLQPSLVSGPGLLAAAACSWNAAEIAEHDTTDDQPSSPARLARLAARLDWWWIEDPEPGLGAALLALGDFYRLATSQPLGKGPMNGSNLFHLFSWIDQDLGHKRFGHLAPQGLGRVARAAETIREGLEQRRSGDEQETLIWLCDICLWCCDLGLRRLTLGREQPASALAVDERTALAQRLEVLARRRKRLWLRHNRSGGWAESARHFERALHALRTPSESATSS